MNSNPQQDNPSENRELRLQITYLLENYVGSPAGKYPVTFNAVINDILALFQAEQAKAKSAHFHFDLDKENRVTLHYPSDLPLKAAIDRTVKCFRKQMDAEQKRLLERAEDKILKDIGGKAPKYVAMNSDCMEGWDICKTDVLNALDELKLEQPE